MDMLHGCDSVARFAALKGAISPRRLKFTKFFRHLPQPSLKQVRNYSRGLSSGKMRPGPAQRQAPGGIPADQEVCCKSSSTKGERGRGHTPGVFDEHFSSAEKICKPALVDQSASSCVRRRCR